MLMRTSVAMVLISLALTLTSAAQGPGHHSRRGPQSQRQPSHEERRERDALRQSLIASFRSLRPEGEKGAKAERNFRRMTGQISRFTSLKELRDLAGLEPADQVRGVVKHWETARARMRQHFMRRLDPKLQAELKQLKGQALETRLAAVRAERFLGKAIRNAKRYELISLEEAAQSESGSSEEKLRFARDLNRRVFLHAYRDIIDPAERTRLEGLSSNDFWRDAAVRKFRLSAFFSKAEIDRLRRLDRSKRRQFLRDLRDGAKIETLRAYGVLDDGMIAVVGKLAPRDRHRLARDLERVHFQDRRRFGLPPELRSRLSREEMKSLRGLTDPERQAYLAKKFPKVDWKAHEERHAAVKALRQKLGEDWRKFVRGAWRGKLEELRPELIQRLGDEAGGKAYEFFKRMVSERRRGGRDPRRQDSERRRGGFGSGGRGRRGERSKDPRDRPDRGSSGQPGSRKDFREKLKTLESKLSAEDRVSYDKLGFPERLKFLRERFPKELPKRRRP